MEKIVVYGTNSCTKCKQLSSLMKSKNVEHEYKHVGHDISVEQLSALLGRPLLSVPVIMVDGKEVSLVEMNRRLNRIRV